MGKRSFAVSASTVVLAALQTQACASVGGDDDAEDVSAAEDAIVGHVVANGEHAEVALLSLVDSAGKKWICTGTFVGRRTLLTARHCLVGVIRPDGSCTGFAAVDTIGAGAARATRLGLDRCVVPDLGPQGRDNDLALVRVASAPVGIVPAVMAHGPPRDPFYTVYGYGGFGAARGSGCAERSDEDNKRKATYRGPLGWHFGRFVCPSDSGGPHFATGTNLIVGVSSTATFFGVDIQAVAWRYASVLEAHVRELERP